ncbi:MAG: ATP-binding protein, partial [Synechococcaceae cyanobacterium]
PGGLHPFALLRLPQAAEHRATIAAWRRHPGAFSPSDYLSLSQLARANADQLSAEPLLAFLRLGQGDSQLFLRLLPRLRELLPGLVVEERLALLECVAQVDTMHFPLDSAEQKAMAEGVQALLRAVEAAPEPWQPPERQGDGLEREFAWLEALVRARIARLMRGQDKAGCVPLIPPPPPPPPPSLLPPSPPSPPPPTSALPAGAGRPMASPWATLLQELSEELEPELTGDLQGLLVRLALALLLAAQLRPQTLDPLQLPNPVLERRFTQCGGVLREGSFEPTGDTLALLAAGEDLAGRAAVLRLLAEEGPLRRRGLLAPLEGESPLKAPLRLPAPWLAWLAGAGPRPDEVAAPGTPAQRLETGLAWQELVLPAGTLRQLEEIEQHLEHQTTLREQWGMGRRLRPGYRALFHGPPGTGKTLTAALLGQRLGLEVRRVDLSQAVSKYIGETEKNLAALLERAERRQWLLLFDEADALFGKRSETRDAHDRYANQEIADLLQRLETFHGVVILATNLPRNLDEAFLRRFESVVYFPLPGPEQRLRLWREAFSPLAQLEVDLEALAQRHELSGGLILNVVRRVSLQAIAAGGRPITESDLLRAIRRELEKEGKGV